MSLQMYDRLLWPNGRRKAFTLSYDDGVTQDIRLIEMMNQFGIKGTFNLNSGLLGQNGTVRAGREEVSHNKLKPSEIGTVYRGHEIASHGLYHSSICQTDAARCNYEILTCRKDLESLLSHPVTGYAYAFGAYDDTVLQSLHNCGITYARTIQATHSFEVPGNFLIWNPTCHHDDELLLALTDQFLGDSRSFPLIKLFYVWGHSYEFDQNHNWEHMREFLDKISGHDNIWYATNIEIRNYVAAYRQLLFPWTAAQSLIPPALLYGLAQSHRISLWKLKPGRTTKLPAPIPL